MVLVAICCTRPQSVVFSHADLCRGFVLSRYEYTGAAGSLKTNITTDKKITTLLEKPLSELSAISVSAELDHKQGTCKYGIGMQFLQ